MTAFDIIFIFCFSIWENAELFDHVRAPGLTHWSNPRIHSKIQYWEMLGSMAPNWRPPTLDVIGQIMWCVWVETIELERGKSLSRIIPLERNLTKVFKFTSWENTVHTTKMLLGSHTYTTLTSTFFMLDAIVDSTAWQDWWWSTVSKCINILIGKWKCEAFNAEMHARVCHIDSSLLCSN